MKHQAETGRLTPAEATAKRKHIEKALKEETTPKLGSEAIRRRVPRRLQYPVEVQTTFVTGCTSAKLSIPSCECILVKFEQSKSIEMAESIAELVYMEARLRLHESLPARIQRRVDACKSARA